MRVPPTASVAAALLVIACGERRPPTPVTTLSAASDTIPTPLSDITTGVWLGGDRWAVLSVPDERVTLVDAKRRSLAPLGASRATELGHPATVFRAGDTLYVGDWGLRRTSLWTLDGAFAGAIPVSDVARGALPQGRDGEGRFYLDLKPRPGADGQGNRDSAAVVRTTASAVRLDTLARLAPLDIAEVASEAGTRFERRVFSGTDAWGVLADGSLWVGRVYANRVDWRSPTGEWQRGEALPDRVLEVTRYDRELFIRRFPAELRSTAQQLPFAPVKPPFEAGLTGPDGTVWLEKSRAPVDSSRAYQVVDRTGRLRREVRIPGPGRIVAVSRDAVLVAEPARDGVRLLRFTVPAAPAATDVSLVSRFPPEE
jgi:hypothetical protein